MSVRVLVVDDSQFYRRRITEILNADAKFEVVGTARNGLEAVELTRALQPDVVTMDVEMPVMDGITATRHIMATVPTPILMFSALTTTGARATFDALEAGAIDYVPKRFDEGDEQQDQAIATLCRRICQLKQVKPRTQSPPVVRLDTPAPASAAAARQKFDILQYRLLAIGTSTGGPVALSRILSKLPRHFPLPVLLIQHMPGNFTPAFAQRLNELCQIKVKEAENGDVLENGVAYLAPGGYQTTMMGKPGRLSLAINKAKDDQIYKPSVDIFLQSLVSICPDRVLAIILTGMGSDGTEGAKQLKRNGATIWAQDQQSSLVFSMPASVAAAGVVDRVLSLDAIGNLLADAC